MYEIRIKLPHLSDANPRIDEMKRVLIARAARGSIDSYASDGDESSVSIVWVGDDALKDATATAGK